MCVCVTHRWGPYRTVRQSLLWCDMCVHVCVCHTQVGSIQDSEAIIAVVDAADRPKEALAMFQPGRCVCVCVCVRVCVCAVTTCSN